MSIQSSTLPYPGLAGEGESLGERWNRWWFEPVSPLNLGICRLLFFALLFTNMIQWPMAAWVTLPKSFFLPIWTYQKFHIPIFSYPVMLALEIAWKAGLALSCVGLFTRTSTKVAAVLGFYLVGVKYCYGKVDHTAGMFLFATAILALSRCGDAVSIDAWLRRRGDPSPVPPSGEYRWPVRMVWVLMSVVFFNAGMAKIIHGSVGWVFSENFSFLLMQRHYQSQVPALPWGLLIAKHRFLYEGAAAGTIVAETFLFVALFSRKLRLVVPWMLLGMQTGIGLFMRVWFFPYMITYLFWVPWDKIYLRLARRPA